MTETEIANVISLLSNHTLSDGGRLLSPCIETYFKCCRETKDGKQEEVVVTIRDFGNRGGGSRYVAAAAAKDGRHAAAGDGPTIESAIGTIRWSEMDI